MDSPKILLLEKVSSIVWVSRTKNYLIFLYLLRPSNAVHSQRFSFIQSDAVDTVGAGADSVFFPMGGAKGFFLLGGAQFSGQWTGDGNFNIV